MSVQFPIGQYEPVQDVSEAHIKNWIVELQNIPNNLREILKNRAVRELEMPIREQAWTVKQLVHHIADANMNSYLHFKLALSEDNPIIKPYDEARWADMVDESQHDIQDSMLLLQSILGRWVTLLQSMSGDQWNRTFVHPVTGSKVLNQYLGFCLWHNQHHISQIKSYFEQ